MSQNEHIFSVAAGAFAGISSTVVSHPFDLLRTRLAASREATGVNQKTLRCHLKELCKDGIARGLTQGLLMNLIASTPSNAIYLPSYNYLKKTTQNLGFGPHFVPIVSAVGAVTTTNVTLAPFFILRTRRLLNGSLTTKQIALSIMEKDGIRGFWRGTSINIAGRIFEEGIFWYVLEQSRRVTQQGYLSGGVGATAHFWNGLSLVGLTMIAKLTGTAVSYPYNVVMTHLREVNKVTGLHEHTQILPTMQHVFKKDGIPGFYRGLSPTLLRSIISKVTQVLVFEALLAWKQ